MMYDLKDEVRVALDGELKEGLFTIKDMSDDEESFTVENGVESLSVNREDIMEDWEIDKLAVALMKHNTVEVDEYEHDEEYEEELLFTDSTIDGLAMNLNSFSTVDELYDWWNRSVDSVQFDTSNEVYHLISKLY